jgi:hypothetical protein
MRLYSKIEKAKNLKEDEQNLLAALLSHWQALLNWSKSTPYNIIFENAYNEFANEIQKGIKNKDFSLESDSYKTIEWKYLNLISLQSRFNIETKWLVSSSLSKLTWEVQKKKNIANKNIDDYSIEEAKWALEILNINYHDYVNRTTNDIGSSTLSALDWQSDTNIFQEKLIEKILWNNEWFNKEYIQGYDETTKNVWNYIIKISEYKDIIKNKPVTEWNSKALSNYFKYLKSNWELTAEILQNKDLIWKDKLIELWKFWNKNPNDAIAKKILEENWLGEIVTEIMDFWKFFNDILNDLKNSNTEADDKINNLSFKEKEKSKMYLRKNTIKALEMKENYNYCPERWTYAHEISETTYEIAFNIKIDELWLNRFKNKNWETADVYLKNILKHDFCASKMVDWLNDYLNSDWEEMDFENIKKILWTYVDIKNEKINFELSQILTKNQINELSQIYLPKEREEYIKKNSKKQLSNEELAKYIKLSNWLQQIWRIGAAWLEKATLYALTTHDWESLKQTLENADAINHIEKTLIEYKSKYLKVINDLWIYKNKVTDIRVVLYSDIALKKLLYIEKTKWLDDSQSELIGLLLAIDYVNKDTDRIQKEQYNIKIERENEENNKEKTNNKLKLDIKNNNYYITNEESYNKVEWWYNLIWKNWETIEWLIISEEEKKLTMWNPEATENLIHFYEFFKELNLESIWKYRKELMISMWNRNINFIDNDSLSKSELIQFWNSLILSINNLIWNKKEYENKPKLLITNSLSWVKSELRKFSWAWSILSDEKTYDIKWEDKFASTLRSFWIIWWAYFKINEFRKNIKW